MKKILLLMLMVMVMLPSVLRAQQMLTVANGTSTNEYVPVYGYYCDEYVRSQTIYPESMVSDMIGGTIESMTFYATSSSVYWGSSFVVKLGTTTASTLNDDWDNSQTTQVYSGVLSVDANGTMTVTFTTPFSYNGGNLLLDIYSTTLGDYEQCYFYGVNASGASTQGYDYEDISYIYPYHQDFIPKTTFAYNIGAITCPAVSGLTSSNVDDQSATITWSPRGTESSWDIYLATSSTDVPDDNTTPTYTSYDSTYDFAGLTASTRYYAYVRANCGAGDVSSWRNVNFLTSQIPAQLPYTCDFEDATENGNWTLQNNGINAWCIGSAVNTSVDGFTSLYISSNNGTSNTYNNVSTSTSWAYRDIDFENHGEYIVNFKYRNEGESNSYDYLKVYIGAPAEPVASGSSSGTGCTPAGAILLGTYSGQQNWQDASFLVPATFSGVQRLYFLWWNDGSAGDNPPAAIDDIEITYTDCGLPTNLVATGIGANDVTIHFEPAMATDNAWEAMICSATDTVVEAIFDNNYTFLNLTPNTQYTIKVRTDCGNDEYSRWTNAISVRTNCATYVAPFMENFANFNTAMSPCWHRYSGLAADVFAGTASLTTTTSGWLFTNSNVFPVGHPKVNVYGTSCEYWLVTPDIDLSALANPTLTFSLALTKYNTANPIDNPANQADDKFMVIVSTDGGSTWSESNATVWSDDATIADYPYSTISNQGQDVQIDLTQYAGQTVQIAFYTESTVSGGDNDLHIADVVVGEPVTCFKPGAITIDSLDAEQIFFSWSPVGTESTWEYICVPAGTDVADDAVWEVAYDTTANVMNLNGNTLYDLYLRAVCGSSEYSVARTISFRTDCGAAATPYFENFDSFSSGATVPCWTVLGGTVAVNNNTTYSHSGSNSLKFSGSYSNMIAMMPFATEISDLEMTFYTRPESSSSSCGTFSVGYVTDVNNPSSFVAVETYSYSDFAVMTEKTVNFANAPAGSQIAFRHVPTSTIYYWFLDDIDVHDIPTCLKPSHFAISGTTSTSVSFSWTEDGSADTWNVAYGPSGFTIDENSNMEVVYTTPTLTIDNLTAGTLYDFYVQSDCGDEVSMWRGPISAIPGSYNMPTTGTDTMYACDLTIYDNGGANGNYSDNCDGYLVLFPENDGQYLSLTGSITAESSSFDYVEIYDGVGTSHLLYKSNQSSGSTVNFGPFTSSDGPLTIRFRSDGSNNYAGIVLNTECITCVAPVVTVSNVDMYEATLTWGDNFGQATAWQVVYGPAGFNMSDATPEDVYTNSITLSNLDDNAAYDFYIRTDCGDGTFSMWSAATNFMTLAGTPAPTPYFCDFEDAEENASWALVNGTQTNKWYIGMPTGATDSILYISSDNGTTADYSISSASYVWAYRDIAFGTGAEFNLSFNWKAYGESTYDYFKVYMGSPASVVGGSETAPESAVVLAELLNQQSSWQHFEQYISGDYSNTVQRLYFLWRNDGSVGTSPAAMIDSIQVTVSDCGRPYGLSASNVTTNSFDVSFSPALATDASWEYVVCAAGASPDASTPEVASDTTFTVTGVSASSTYNVYVRTICDGGGYSAWSNMLVVTTACGAIEALPYTNNFDTYGTGESAYPLCWGKINTYSSNRPYVSSTYSFSAPGSLYFYAGSNGTYNIAVTPEFDASIAINTLQATFKYRTSYESDELIVGVMTDPTDATTFEAVDTVVAPSTNTWIDAEVYFNNYTGNGQYIAFKNAYTTTSGYGYMDNLVIDVIPSCVRPHNLVATDASTNSITLSWNEVGSSTQWNIEYGPAGFTQGSGTPVIATSNPFTVTGLTAATMYDFYVQADCGGGDFSAWSNVATMSTECDALSLPYVENFDSYTGTSYSTPGITPTCWTTTTTNTSYPAPHVVSSSVSTTYCYPHSGTNCLVFTCGSAGADAYAILPEFDQPLNTLSLNFYRAMESSTSGTLTVGYVTTADPSSFVTVATIPNLYYYDGGDTITVDFTGSNIPANGNIAFHWNYTTSYYSCCIDDINVTLADNPGPGTTCDAPTNVAASNIAQTSATITWTPGGDETSWNLQYKAAADANWSSNITVNNTPSYALTGLTANTAYQVRVQAVCDASSVSDWANGTFTTLNNDEPSCPAPTNVEANNITKNSAVITWSQEPNTASSWTVLYKQTVASAWESASANAMTYTLSGLNPETQYDVQVMANCEGGTQSAASETIHFTTQPDGVNNYDLDNSISVYPNPTSGLFTINNEQCTINSVDIYDVYGKLISTTKVEDTHVTLDINTYADGVYFARILTDKGVVTKRIVKK